MRLQGRSHEQTLVPQSDEAQAQAHHSQKKSKRTHEVHVSDSLTHSFL